MRTSLRRLWLAAFLLSAFLTVQLAAAAYACDGSRYSLGATHEMAGMTEACPDMAKDGAGPGIHDGLCQEHCQLGSKSADHATPQIPAFQPVLVNVVVPTPVPGLAHRVAVPREAISRAPPRPLPILNCCFRT
ncbi:copper resistance protein [Cupriavidus sp. L7L]|uniref:copper resistance protein n=1 Tax=Cupriavidus sp. L7L TaxID=2546443 RepID=UPI001055BC4A|nr:copper resistance protein [Cupriavidus sp. L7L]TDF62532.1 copper resistance protein [Cupriavidus sp. L7L]